MKPIQYFSDEYLEQIKGASPAEIAEFLESVRILSEASKQPHASIPISIKIPSDLLKAFRQRCEMEGVRYQTKMKQLMAEWLAVR